MKLSKLSFFIVQVTWIIARKSYNDGDDCPASGEKCAYDGGSYQLRDYGTPPCWSAVDKEWKCKPRVNESNCPEGFIDVEDTCGFDPLPPPQCPLPDDNCKLEGNIFIAKNASKKEDDFPYCWNKNPDNTWSCKSSSAECDINGKDLRECFKLKPVCPKLPTETCRFGLTLDVPASGPYINNAVCWSKNSNGEWECKKKEGFDCAQYELDITNCFKKKLCPERKDPCLYDAKVYKIDTIGAPKCWSKTSFGWNCKFPPAGTDTCKNEDTDIDTCFPEDKISCPKSYYDACKSGNSTYIAGDAGDNDCWSKTKDGDWSCRPKPNNSSICGRGEVDVSICGVPPLPSPDCPTKYNETCRSIDDSDELAGEPNEFVCWKKNALKKWVCSPKTNGKNTCEPGNLDITSCTLEPPPVPECPKDYFTPCKDIDNKEFLAGKPLGNVCWYNSGFNRWGCTARSKATNLCEHGLLDITRCNIELPTPPSCPSDTETTCITPNGIINRSNVQNNVCWSIKNKKWHCNPKPKGSGNCDVGELDISQCSGISKLPFNCPKEYQTLCKSKEGFKAFGRIKHNFCWKQDTSTKSWECQTKVNGTCKEGFLDIQLCSKPEIPAFNKMCPSKYETYCKSKDGYKMAGEETKDICWEIDSNGDYICEGLLENTNRCKPLKINILACSLLPPSPPKCPTKSTDYCMAGGRKIIAGEVKINSCWGISPSGGYYCIPKESNGTCKPSLVDIDKCNIPAPQPTPCPKRNDKCHYQGKSYGIYDESTPKCWVKDQEKWECEPIFSQSAKCPGNAVDISKCFPPLPKCPASFTSVCQAPNSEQKIMAGKPGNNVCWNKNKQGDWECYPMDIGEKYCSPGFLDVTTCSLPYPKVPSCPKSYTDVSFSDKKLVLAGEPGINVCWSFQGNNRWISSPRPNKYLACKPGDLDITTCNFVKPNPPPCPEKYQTRCTKGSDSILAGKPGKNVCWRYNGKSWDCNPKEESLEECRYNEINVNKCSLEAPETPSCPKDYLTECEDSEGKKHTISNPGGKICWFYDFSDGFNWKCSSPLSKGKVGCNDNQLDISKCEIKKPATPECPPISAVCKMNNKVYELKDSKSPSCWKPGYVGYDCINKVEGNPAEVCPLGYVNKDICKYEVPECPPKTSICRSEYSIHKFSDESTPNCWSKFNYEWKCMKPEHGDKCPINSIDIKKC
ncbi:hypothetical protein K502DRAFT_199627 [Neoconidiobolus thromboides FSU 785]|nr:hypothetical protein K502DRAFT_199627 [Neoconidiobolus thromboides FSU 785]